jgi:hypothetical protein
MQNNADCQMTCQDDLSEFSLQFCLTVEQLALLTTKAVSERNVRHHCAAK